MAFLNSVFDRLLLSSSSMILKERDRALILLTPRRARAVAACGMQ